MEMKSPVEILAYTSDVGVAKTRRPLSALLIQAFLAGVFIAFAAAASNMAAYNLLENQDTYGLGKLLQGAVFGTGLLLVVTTGGELFTGNMLIIVSVLDRRVAARQMLTNWILVYVGNFAGSLFIVWMMSLSGLFDAGGGHYGGVTIKIAAAKTNLPFHSAFVLGIMCNWLVCLAVWVSYGTRDIVGKAAAVFPIVGIFVLTGFEHSIANMFYIPAGILAQQPQLLDIAQVSAEKLANLNWEALLFHNLIPVTLGNIVGGSVMVGAAYWLALGKTNQAK